MKISLGFYLACLAVLLITSKSAYSATAKARFALVIGNGAYSEIGALPNPAADAQLIASTLSNLGFETQLAVDTSQFEMKKAIANFGRTLRRADKNAVGFFYYAGHGIQSKGRNYLLPVEATPTDEADLDLMGVEANWVLRQMESAGNRTNIIVLDACRNNPFVSANRSLGRGLAQIDAPTGSFISYATAPGKVALDGDNENSPFTTALAQELNSEGTPIEQIFKKVRVNVIQATGGQQIPWDSSSLVEDFYIKETPEGPEVPRPEVTSNAEQELWTSISDSGDVGSLSYFLQLYPNGPFADMARQRLEQSLLAIASPEPESDQSTVTNAGKPAPPSVTSARNSSELVPADDTPEPVNTVNAPQEFDIYAQAESSRNAEDYRRYLELHPNGKFAAIVVAELEHLQKQSDLLLTNGSNKGVETTAQSTGNINYTSPIILDTIDKDAAQSIEQLAQGTPLHAPFEGLEEVHWKTQNCSNCHNWDKNSLCTQGEFYTSVDEEALKRIKHPYGGEFKANLRIWAEQGCN